MIDASAREYFRGRWPEEHVPKGQPPWLYYEVDKAANAVIRTVEVFADGRINRNSIEIEERHGDKCPSLIDGPLESLLSHSALEATARSEFEDLWARGVDTAFWSIR